MKYAKENMVIFNIILYYFNILSLSIARDSSVREIPERNFTMFLVSPTRIRNYPNCQLFIVIFLLNLLLCS
jgi:hypothetical protein